MSSGTNGDDMITNDGSIVSRGKKKDAQQKKTYEKKYHPIKFSLAYLWSWTEKKYKQTKNEEKKRKRKTRMIDKNRESRWRSFCLIRYTPIDTIMDKLMTKKRQCDRWKKISFFKLRWRFLNRRLRNQSSVTVIPWIGTSFTVTS